MKNVNEMNLNEAFYALDIAEEKLELAEMDGAHFAISETEMEIDRINARIKELSK